MLKKFIQKKCNIYSGYIYKANDGVLYINKNNLNEKAEIIEGPIFYKRGFMDLYVKEINSGKRIFTYPLKKIIKFPKKYFVAIDRRRNFKEPLITLSYREIAEKYNLNLFTDAIEILKKMVNQKSELVECYNQEKPSNYKEILNQKMNRNINLNIKSSIKKIDLNSKINDLKNKFNKEKPEEEKTLEQDLNLEEYKEETIIEDVIVEKTKNDDLEIIENKETEFIDNVEGLKVKKYDLCKEPKYIYGFNLKVKPVINLSTNEKSFEQVITEMVYLNNLGYNVYAEVDSVKISTRVLKTTEELVEYYNFRKNDVFPTTTNAKIMARASRKLEKQKIKNMI